MRKVRHATSPTRHYQVTTDRLQAYLPAVGLLLADRCDFVQLVKIYASLRKGEQRYSPAEGGRSQSWLVKPEPVPNMHLAR